VDRNSLTNAVIYVYTVELILPTIYVLTSVGEQSGSSFWIGADRVTGESVEPRSDDSGTG
jgi:hypothetical protein